MLPCLPHSTQIREQGLKCASLERCPSAGEPLFSCIVTEGLKDRTSPLGCPHFMESSHKQLTDLLTSQ